MLRFLRYFCLLVTLTTLVWGKVTSLEDTSLEVLESQLLEIERALERLSHLNWRSGVGSQGFRSAHFTHQDQDVAVQINFDEPHEIDLLVLVPAIWRSSSNHLVANGFPLRFRIVGGLGPSAEGATLVEYEIEEEAATRHLAPLALPVEPILVSWLRLEVKRVSIRRFDNHPVLQLAEFFAFSGAWNVALGSQVTATSTASRASGGGPWAPRFLVDGAVPYMRDSATNEGSVAYSSAQFGEKTGDDPWPYLALDLGESYRLSRIHLHVVEHNDSVPQAYSAKLGIPDRFRIYGSEDSDFSEKTILGSSLKVLEPYEIAPVLVFRFPETRCRYVRIVAERPAEMSQEDWQMSRIGLAEIECFQGETNVALGAEFSSNIYQKNKVRNPVSLTDGKNLYGEILPERRWLQELALRHNLEQEKQVLEKAISARYVQQRGRLRWMSWLVPTLISGLIIVFLIGRAINTRKIGKIRERYAADLHDEIGANVHAISLLTDVASVSGDNREKLEMLHEKIRRLARRTGVVIANWGEIGNAQGVYHSVVEDMQRAAQNIVGNLEHDIVVRGESYIQKLRPQIQVDIYLFYKECLINIARHAEATSFSSVLTVSPEKIELEVRDNGKGMPSLSKGAPKSLSRRAGLLKATLEVKNDSQSGVHILLTLNSKKHFV